MTATPNPPRDAPAVCACTLVVGAIVLVASMPLVATVCAWFGAWLARAGLFVISPGVL